MNRAVAAGDLERAVAEVSRELDTSPDALPDTLTGDKPLLLLERGTLRYAAQEHERSSADLETADKHLELLDLTDDTAGDIGRFLFSDDSKVYVAPPFEKLMLSTLNLINYLTRGDLEGARVETRRLRITQQAVAASHGEVAARTGIGSYVAGFALEHSGEADEALRCYDEALGVRPFPSLAVPASGLARRTAWRGEHVAKVLAEAPPPDESGDLLVVVGLGRVPHKEAMRVPIGLALTWAAAVTGSHAMTPEAQAQAASLAARGLVTWVMFPTLEPTPTRFDTVALGVGGAPVELELAADLGEEAVASFDAMRGLLIGSAITRTVTRVLAGLAAEEGAKAGGSKNGLALLLGLAVQGGLAAADTPDTRSWVTLPRAFFVGRTRVPAGPTRVELRASGDGALTLSRDVNVPAGGFRVVALTVLQ
ncbi:MAG: hypothetical protein AMXMBFR64_56350 [Myxococcales bacterium]